MVGIGANQAPLKFARVNGGRDKDFQLYIDVLYLHS